MSAGALVVVRRRGLAMDRRRVAAGVGSLVALSLVVALPRLNTAPPAGGGGTAAAQSGWASVPFVAQLAISRAIGADQPTYQLRGDTARVPGQKLAFHFSAAGVTAAAAGQSAELGLRGRATTPSIRANRVTYHRGPISEWYANGPFGLEQGFVLARSAPTVLALRGGGSLHPRIVEAGAGLQLVTAAGRPVLSERGLSAHDASGRALGVRFVHARGGVAIAVASVGARFPVTIDPVIQQAKLTASDGYANEGNGKGFSNGGISAGGLGASVAIDGSTIAVGAPGAAVANGNTTSYQGAVYVFSKPSSGWGDATQTAKLVADDGAGAGTPISSSQTNVYGDALGSTVAISGDTIVAGAPRAIAGGQAYAGKLYVFTAPPTGGWVNAFQTAELAAHDATVDDFLGSSLAFDGQTIVSGVSNRYPNATNSAYVFTKPASGGWVNSHQEAREITDPSYGDDSFGSAVALSGSTIAVGASRTTDNTLANAGAVYTFTDPGSGWTSTPVEAKLTPTSPVTNETMGRAVAIDGATLVAGASHGVGNGGPSPSGAAYVFTEAGTSWAGASQARLTPSDAAASDGFGSFVGVSGSTVLATGFPSGTGELYSYLKPANGWAAAQEGAKDSLAATGASGGGPLAVQGSTLVAGAQNANAGSTVRAGAAYVLSSAPGAVSSTSTSASTTTAAPSTTSTVPVAPPPPPLVYTSTPVFVDTTTAADIIAGLFGLTPGSGETENLGEFTFVAYCRRPQGQCAAGTSFGQQLGTNTAAHGVMARASKKKPKPIIYGTGRISIAAGKHGAVTVRLTKLGRQLLTKRHVLHGTLRITLGAPGSGDHAFTLHYKPKRHKAKHKHH